MKFNNNIARQTLNGAVVAVQFLTRTCCFLQARFNIASPAISAQTRRKRRQPTSSFKRHRRRSQAACPFVRLRARRNASRFENKNLKRMIVRNLLCLMLIKIAVLIEKTKKKNNIFVLLEKTNFLSNIKL